MSSTKRRAAAATAVIAVALTGCTSANSNEPPPRTVHEEGKGPLSTGYDQGGKSTYAPGHAPWHATWGGFLLCSNTGQDITVTGVRPKVSDGHEPKSVDVRVRTGGTNGITGSAVGVPPRFEGSDRKLDGKIERFQAPVKVSTRCGGPESKAVELLVTMKVAEPGAVLDGLRVDYMAKGRNYTLKVDWKMIGCGSRTPTEVCGGSA